MPTDIFPVIDIPVIAAAWQYAGMNADLQVVTAQTSALANEPNQVDIRRRRMNAAVLLVKALGGSWQAEAAGR
jgi:outer membrane protein TolC